MKEMISIKLHKGDEFYFPYFMNYCNVTNYYSDNIWYFTICGDNATEHRSQVLPSEVIWIKKRDDK